MSSWSRLGILTVTFVLTLLPAFGLQAETYRSAYDAGFSDGKAAGHEDSRLRKPFDFANRSAYQSADRGLDPVIQDREVYAVAYRRGFQDGYEEGFGLTPSRSQAPAVLGDGRPAQTEGAGPATDGEGPILKAGTRIPVKLVETLTTQRNLRGDKFSAEVLHDVTLNDATVIPEGSLFRGTVTHLKRPGRIKGRAEMTLRFDQLELPDGTTLSVVGTVSAIEARAKEKVKDAEGTLEGASSTKEDVRKVGASSGIGALIGVLTGGGRGAGVGAATGAIVGVAGALASRGEDIVLFSETELEVRLDEALTIPVDARQP